MSHSLPADATAPGYSAADAVDLSTYNRLMQLKRFGVLQHVAGHLIDARQGVIVAGCGDCDRRERYAEFLRREVHDRRHFVMLNGGALTMPVDSPLYSSRDELGTMASDGLVMLNHVRNAARLKDIDKVALVAHFPCGAAMGVGLSFEEMVDLLLKAKLTLKGRSPGLKVACFLSVDWDFINPHARRVGERTYFMSRGRAMEWFGNPPAAVIDRLLEEAETGY